MIYNTNMLYTIFFVRYLSAINPDQKSSILDFCLKEGHEDYKIGSCDKCFNLYIYTASSLVDWCTEQNHLKLAYRISSGSGSKEETVNSEYILCKSCNDRAKIQSLCQCQPRCETSCEHIGVCDHRGARFEARLKPLTLGLHSIALYTTLNTIFLQVSS